MSKRKSKTGAKIGIAVIVNLVILFFLVIGFGREYVSNLQIEREIQNLEEERELLEQDKLSTLQLIDQLSSEYYLEKEARSKHGLGRDGETLIIVQHEDSMLNNQVGAVENLSDISLEEIGNPLRWYYYFFDKDHFALLQDL